MGLIDDILRPVEEVEICGTAPETLITAAAAEGILLWDIEAREEYVMHVRVCSRDAAAFEVLARKCMCSLHFKKRDTRRLLLRRLPLFAALMLSAALLVLSGFFIWDIDIYGDTGLSKAAILRALSDAGLETGSFRPDVDPELVRSRALTELPELSWLGVSLAGSRAEVTVIGREEQPPLYGEKKFSDIEAAKTGVIKDISVYSGQSLVKAGQTVNKGDTLVTGVVESISSEVRLVRSEAEINAYTWYELSARIPAMGEEKVPTGHTHERFALIFGKKRINFYFGGRNNIDECDKIIYEYKIGIEGVFAMPVTLVRESMRDYRLKPIENVTDSLKELLYDTLKSDVNGEILNCGYSSALADGILRVTLRAHCLENIAVERNSE